MGRGTRFLLAMLAAVCIAAAFLSPLFTTRAPLLHGKSPGASGYMVVAWAALLIDDLAMLAQIRAGTVLARSGGASLLALTCARLC